VEPAKGPILPLEEKALTTTQNGNHAKPYLNPVQIWSGRCGRSGNRRLPSNWISFLPLLKGGEEGFLYGRSNPGE
jgi:hypothetical protein